MLDRDAERLVDAARRADRSPAGSGAVAGSGLRLDRASRRALGFGGVTANSIDAVADRDYALETVAALAILLGHLSAVGELVLWSTPYVGFVRLDDAFSSGSSMLPNKRNPDSAELVRARAARVEGDLVTSCPSSAACRWPTTATCRRRVARCSTPSTPRGCAWTSWRHRRDARLRSRSNAPGRGRRAFARRPPRRSARGAGCPFRDAHRRVGRLVAAAEEAGVDLGDLPADPLNEALPELDGASEPTLEDAVAAPDVHGGTAPERVREAWSRRASAWRRGPGMSARSGSRSSERAATPAAS